MPQIPQYERETKLNGTPLPYQNPHITGEMFGASQAQASANLAKGLEQVSLATERIADTIDETKIMSFNNAVEKWRQDNLLDKESGYLVKQGVNAAGKSPELMQNYDDFVQDWKSKNKVSNLASQRIGAISENKRTNIQETATRHDIQQTKVYATNEAVIGIENATNNAISERNNPKAIAVQIENINNIEDWKGLQLNSDSTTISAEKKDSISKVYSGIVKAFLQDGDIDKAKSFFEEHKEEINSDLHPTFIGTIKNEEDKYKARDMANNIIANAKNEEDAYKQAESIKDINLSDSVLSRVKAHYAQEEYFKRKAEEEALNSFYNKAVSVMQNGGTLSYDDIPSNLDPDRKLSLMNYINSNGQPTTDDSIWEELYSKSVNDAQGFAKEDLNKYRGYLSDSEYKSFLKRQEDIKSGNYYTQIKDDDKNINAALKAIGLDRNGWREKTKDIAYSDVKAMVREFEARKGRKITNEELNNIINSLGYTGSGGVQMYKQLDKGVREKAGFTRDVMNDFAYYQNQHNGQFPPDSEKLRIINNRLNQKVQEKKTSAQNTVNAYTYNDLTMRNISYTKAKPHEQKVLTYFADNQIPTISKQLGVKLTITSRYRNQAGSHHSEGRAGDVSMSEHSAKNRIRIYEKLLNLSTVQAIGTSDPNILTHFAGNPKIVDERRYDRQHGTNHTNHAHVTLINYNPANSGNKKTSQNGVYKF